MHDLNAIDLLLGAAAGIPTELKFFERKAMRAIPVGIAVIECVRIGCV